MDNLNLEQLSTPQLQELMTQIEIIIVNRMAEAAGYIETEGEECDFQAS